MLLLKKKKYVALTMAKPTAEGLSSTSVRQDDTVAEKEKYVALTMAKATAEGLSSTSAREDDAVAEKEKICRSNHTEQIANRKRTLQITNTHYKSKRKDIGQNTSAHCKSQRHSANRKHTSQIARSHCLQIARAKKNTSRNKKKCAKTFRVTIGVGNCQTNSRGNQTNELTNGASTRIHEIPVHDEKSATRQAQKKSNPGSRKFSKSFLDFGRNPGPKIKKILTRDFFPVPVKR